MAKELSAAGVIAVFGKYVTAEQMLMEKMEDNMNADSRSDDFHDGMITLAYALGYDCSVVDGVYSFLRDKETGLPHKELRRTIDVVGLKYKEAKA